MINKQNKLPVLVYHQIVPDDFSVESFPPGDQPYFSRFSEFYSHLDYLSNHNFSTLTVDEIGNFKKDTNTYKKVAITCDDGQVSDYTIVFPSLIERKMRATFYVITDIIGKKGYVTWENLKEMQEYGMEIGSHSCTHRCFLDLSEKEIQIELLKSREILEDRLECPILSFSIPFGFCNRRVVDLAIEAGYQTVCTSEVKLSSFKSDSLVYGRIGIRRGDGVNKFKGIVEMEWQTIGKFVVEDRVKSALKRFLGRGLWYKFRSLVLSRQNNS